MKVTSLFDDDISVQIYLMGDKIVELYLYNFNDRSFCYQYSPTMGFLYDWWEERLEIQCIADDILAKILAERIVPYPYTLVPYCCISMQLFHT